MKKLITILGLCLAATLIHAQGYIAMNGSAAGVKTNTGSFYTQVSGTSGNISSQSVSPFGYYFALLFTTSTNGFTSMAPTNSGWSLATLNGGGALFATNGVIAGSVAGNNTSGGVQVNMVNGTAFKVELVGWSASLGTDITTVLGEYSSGSWNANGYFGYTTVGTMTPAAAAGGGDPSLFSTTWANNTMTLWSVAPVGVPEPSTMALAALGGASLLLFRRRKH